MHAALLILRIAAAYIALGALFAGVFLTLLLPRVDHGAKGAPPTFRLLILPGVIALWPVLLVRCVRPIKDGAEPFRKMHMLAWIALAVLIPAVIAAALYVRPPAPTAPVSATP
ncbi:MAG: hypothetical protein AB7G17_12035 [Phycisphaerales bacterium]